MAKIAMTLFLMALAACASPAGSAEDPEIPTPTTVDGTSTTTEEPTLQSLPRSDAELLALAEEARSDLAERLGVPIEEIAVTGAAVVTWNDGSIGCPEPGMSYTQALIDGARVTLLHDDVTYAYHQGGDGLFLCEEPSDGSFTVSKDDSGALELTPPPGFDE
jgi:hypothetical protein